MARDALKKYKRFIFMSIIIVFLIVVSIAAIVLTSLFNCRSVSPNITVTGIRSGTETQHNYILAKVEDRYYEIAPSTDFMQKFLFDDWENVNEISAEADVVISLQFAELLVVDIYENGMIAAYDGYASRRYKSFAYYTMPVIAVETIGDFLEENAISHEFGDGIIGNSTFRHD